jgi:type IV pilus assembly protein PilW
MSELSPGITGLDEKSLSATSEDIRFPVHSTAHSSDILALRFYGSSQPTSTSARTSAAHIADNTIQNCAGFGIAAPENTQTERAWSIYYVATGATGEPELFCKYQGKKGWRATAIARGIASFQVRYGFNHTSTDFMSASQLHALDAALPLTGSTPSARTIELHQKSHWKKVTSVQISILLRSAKIAGSHATSLNKALLQRTHGERLQRVFSIIIQRQNFAY